MATLKSPIQAFIWPFQDPITKSFVTTIESFFLHINTELNKFGTLPELHNQIHSFSIQFRALLETFLYQLKITLVQYQQDYPILTSSSPPETYITSQSRTFYSNNVTPDDLFLYIQTCETIKHVVAFFEIAHFDPNNNITAQCLQWFQSSHPVPAEFAQFLASVPSTSVLSDMNDGGNNTIINSAELLTLPFGKDINSVHYWKTCSTLLSQGRVIELVQLFDINPQLELPSGIGDISWKTLLLTIVLFCPSLNNIITDYTLQTVDLKNDTCCMLGSLGLCCDPIHNVVMKRDVGKGRGKLGRGDSGEIKDNKGTGKSIKKRKKFGIVIQDDEENDGKDEQQGENDGKDEIDDNLDFFDRKKSPQKPPSTLIWSSLTFEERFSAWKSQIEYINTLGLINSSRFFEELPYKLISTCINFDETIETIFFEPVFENLLKNIDEQLDFEEISTNIALYLLLFRFPSITRVEIGELFKEAFGSVQEFLVEKIRQKKLTKKSVQKYLNFLENDQFSDAVRTIITHDMLQSLFILEGLITWSTKEVIGILNYNYFILEEKSGGNKHDKNSPPAPPPPPSPPKTTLINLDNMRTIDGDQLVSIYGFDWLLVILSELVFHASKIELPKEIKKNSKNKLKNNPKNDSNNLLNFDSLVDPSTFSNLFKTNKTLQTIQINSSISPISQSMNDSDDDDDDDNDDNEHDDALQFPYLLPFFPPTTQLKNPPLDLRQRYLYRYIDGIIVGLYSSSEYVKLLAQTFKKEEEFVLEYFEFLFNFSKLSQMSSAEQLTLCNKYNEIDQTMAIGLKRFSMIGYQNCGRNLDLTNFNFNAANNAKNSNFFSQIQFFPFFSKDSVTTLALLFNNYTIGHNPLYIHLLPQRMLTSTSRRALLEPYQEKIINIIITVVRFRCNLPEFLFFGDKSETNETNETNENDNSKEINQFFDAVEKRTLPFSPIEFINFITLLQHQAMSHNISPGLLNHSSNQQNSADFNDEKNDKKSDILKIIELDSNIDSNEGISLDRNFQIGKNFRSQLKLIVKYIIFTQLLEQFFIENQFSNNIFSFLSNPYIESTLNTIINDINTQLALFDLPLKRITKMTKMAKMTTNSQKNRFFPNFDFLQSQYHSMANKNEPFQPSGICQHILKLLFQLNCTTLITYTIEHLISGAYHPIPTTSSYFRREIMTFLTQNASFRNNTTSARNIQNDEFFSTFSTTPNSLTHSYHPSNSNIFFNLQSICLPWECPPFSLITPNNTAIGSEIQNFSQISSLPNLTQNMKPLQYLQNLYFISQFFTFENILHNLNPLTQLDDDKMISLNQMSVLFPNNLLLSTIPSSLEELVLPGDQIAFEIINLETRNDKNDKNLTNFLTKKSFLIILFQSLTNLLIQSFKNTTIQYHKLFFFTWFGLYAQLIQILIHYQFLALVDDPDASPHPNTPTTPHITPNLPISPSSINTFFHSLSQTSMTSSKFSLPPTIMIEFLRTKEELLSASITKLNEFLSLSDLKIINKYITFYYQSPQRIFWTLPSQIINLFTKTPLILQLMDSIPLNFLQIASKSDNSPLSSVYPTQNNSPYIIGLLRTIVTAQELTSTHPLFPTEEEVRVTEERDVVTFCMALLTKVQDGGDGENGDDDDIEQV